jgi:hypothetical protein
MTKLAVYRTKYDWPNLHLLMHVESETRRKSFMSGCSDCNTQDAKEQCDADGVPEFLVNHSQTVATACEDVLGYLWKEKRRLPRS